MVPTRARRLAALLAALAMAASVVSARQAGAPAQTAPLTQPLPVDALVTTGRFANGLRYVIRANKRPEQRAELRLVVDVGSIVEDDDQLGLAHFVEHMAFNGTKNFPKQDIVSFMESIGMRFGPSVNAFTSFDETVYMLQVPTDRPGVLERSFQVLEDWAHNVTFDGAEIDKERGVIIEEWRLRRGAGARMQDQQFPILLKGSRYAERLPIGKTEILQTFPHERLRRFYTDWYRPDLMSVIAVGDFDVAAVEALIRKHFEPLPAVANGRPRPVAEVPDHPGTLYAIASDKEATTAGVTVYAKVPLRDPTTVGAYRQQIVEGLFTAMLNARFSEIAQKAEAPFLGASAGRGLFVRTKEATMLGAGVKEDGIARGLEALFTEAARVARHGFTAGELDREKRNLLRALERAVVEKDNQQSSVYAAEYVRHVTQRESIPGIVYENALYQRFVPEITLAEINALAKDWSPDRNRVVVVSAPQKDGLAIPTEAQLAPMIAAIATKPLEPYAATTTAAALLDALPSPGRVVATTTKPEFGITEWELSNGVTVVLKPTTFKADEILFSAFSPGGTSLASDADYIAANTAGQVVPLGGVGKFSMIELRNVLAGKVASASPSIGEHEERMSGGGSLADLETMFQLIYLRFTAPRADPTLFGVAVNQLKAILTNQAATPEFAFSQALNTALTQDHPRARIPTIETLAQMNLEKSMAFYRDRFADASDFTFIFVGSFDTEQLRPHVERYLASLPALPRKETWKDHGMRPPEAVVEKRVEKGIEPKSRAAIVFTGPFTYNQVNRVAIRAMADVLETRLREVLREDLGGTYSVSAGASYSKIPVPEYSLAIEFGASPERTDALVKTVFEQLELLKTAGPTEQQVQVVREQLLRDFETNMKQNGYILSQLVPRYQFGESLQEFLGIPELYKKLDAAAIQAAAKLYLNPKTYVKVTLFPEKR
jgi:zinc protease